MTRTDKSYTARIKFAIEWDDLSLRGDSKIPRFVVLRTASLLYVADNYI